MVGGGQLADEEHLRILRQGVEVWNRWRTDNPEITPNLSGADLEELDLCGANFSGTMLGLADLNSADLSGSNMVNAALGGAGLDSAILCKANLSYAGLYEADLRFANLTGAILNYTDLNHADLSGAILHWTILNHTDLSLAKLAYAELYRADLSEVDLQGTILVETNFKEATLTNCRIHGISAWDLKLDGAKQRDLIITPVDEPIITVDNLEVAQFIYLLLHSQKIRDAIDTIAKKAVLILGRFTDERKTVLDAIRDELRIRDYLPILFDWDKPASRNLVETVSTLAHLSRFVIADITDAKSIPAELMSIVPSLPSVAVQPLMLSSDYEYTLFDHILSFKSVLSVYLYDTPEMLLANLKEHVIDPAEAKARELIPPAANR